MHVFPPATDILRHPKGGRPTRARIRAPDAVIDRGRKIRGRGGDGERSTRARGGQGGPGPADRITGSSAPPSRMRTCTSFAPGVSAPSGIMLATTHSSCSR